MNKIIEEDTIQIIKNNDMEKLRNSSFLITGASGMVGSYFVNTLISLNKYLNMNIKVICLVRNPQKLDEEIRNNPFVKVIVQDVVNPIELDDDVDYIVHAASPASPLIMKDKPFETNIANTIGTYNTLNLALKKKTKGYLFVSSREIYGEPDENQKYFTEEGPLGQVNPLVPRNGYAEGKKVAENMCIGAKEEYGLNAKIVRLAHTYGPGMSIYDGRVQADFLKNIISEEDIIMKSTGESVRTYTYIADAINAMFKILIESPSCVYNVSSENCEVSIRNLAILLSKLSNGTSQVIMKIDDTNEKGNASFKNGILSSQKIKLELGWKPIYSLEEGFKRTINYLKETTPNVRRR